MHSPFDQSFWDERYRSRGELWSGRPNPQLVTTAADLPPGRALDLGCGEGADALWLAGRGWTVTGVDLSTVALERAAKRAAEVGGPVAGRTDWQQRDLCSWRPDPGVYDLVTAQYLQLPAADREPLFAALAGAVAPGGVLLIVGHHPSDLDTTVPRPPMPDLFYTGEDIAGTLDPAVWDTLTSAVPREVTDPDGEPVTIHDAVLRAHLR